MEKMHIDTKLAIAEIGMTVVLIGILFWFHFEEAKSHDKMMDVLKDIRDNKKA